MVAGDHLHLDARGLADVDGGLCLFSGRVDHADQADEDQVVFSLRRRIRRIHGAVGHADHTKRGLSHLLVDAEDFLPLRVRKRMNGSVFFHSGTAAQQLVRSALGIHGDGVPDLMEGGHELSVRIKGDFLHAGIFAFPFRLLHAVLVGKHHHGGFRGIAHDGLFVGIIGSVVA